MRLPAAESDLKALAPEQVSQLLGGRARLAQSAGGDRGGQRLEFLVLLLAAVLVIAESLLLRR